MTTPSMAPGSGGLVVTRPIEQGAALMRGIEKAGGRAWHLPTIEISPLHPNPERMADRLRSAHWFIFISGNAVQQGWPLLPLWLTQNAQLAAVGKQTALQLKTVSQREVLHPIQGADSEALLSMPALQKVAGQKVVIVRGEGGREWLKSTLSQRGAEVLYLECYKRCLPHLPMEILDDALLQNAAISVQSVESLRNLWQLCDEAHQKKLQQQPFLVTHTRIADAVAALGVSNIYMTEPGDTAIIAGWKNLKAHPYD